MIRSYQTPYTMPRSPAVEQTPIDVPSERLAQTIDFLMERATPRDERAVGAYLVGYTVQQAEGIYQLINGELVWQSPTDENIHLRVSIRDAVDGHFCLNLKVMATLIASSGLEFGPHQQPFIWHPWLFDYGYGRNWRVPQAGHYRLRLTIAAADQPEQPVKVVFNDLDIAPDFAPVR